MHCPNCNEENVSSANFCKNCGNQIFQIGSKSMFLGKFKILNKKFAVFGMGIILIFGVVSFVVLKENGINIFENKLVNLIQPKKNVIFNLKTVSEELKNDYMVTTHIDLELPKLEGNYKGISAINAYYDKMEKELVFMYEGDEVEKDFFVKASFRKETVIDDIISISGDGDRGVSGSVKIYGDVFDLNTGKKLTLDDIFKVSSDKYLDLIYENVSNSIEEEMAKEMEKKGDSRYNDSLKDINSLSTKKEISAFDPGDFFLTDKSLVVFYPQGSFGCNGCGEFKYEIPFDSIASMLKIKVFVNNPSGQSQNAISQTAQSPALIEKNMRTYTNDVYKYKFSYPVGAVIKEAGKNEFSLGSKETTLTFDDIFKKYTGKICLSVIYKDGVVIISAPANEENHFILCSGRTGIGSQSKTVSMKEDILIDGKIYTVDTRDIIDDGKHNYLVWIKLKDTTRITISTSSLETRAILKKVVESYISTN